MQSRTRLIEAARGACPEVRVLAVCWDHTVLGDQAVERLVPLVHGRLLVHGEGHQDPALPTVPQVVEIQSDPIASHQPFRPYHNDADKLVDGVLYLDSLNEA